MSLQSQINNLRNTLQNLLNQAKKTGEYAEIPQISNEDKIGIERNSDGQRFWVKVNSLYNTTSITSLFRKPNELYKLVFTKNNQENELNLKEVFNIVVINGNDFELKKRPNNNNPLSINVIEVGDLIINGYWDNNIFFIRAKYLGGDINDYDNWQKLDFIDDLN